MGAYDWNGAVLKETSSGKVIPLRESYLQEFPEELKNHGAYLGGEAVRGRAAHGGEIQGFIPKNRIFLMENLWDGAQESAHLGRAWLRSRSRIEIQEQPSQRILGTLSKCCWNFMPWQEIPAGLNPFHVQPPELWNKNIPEKHRPGLRNAAGREVGSCGIGTSGLFPGNGDTGFIHGVRAESPRRAGKAVGVPRESLGILRNAGVSC